MVRLGRQVFSPRRDDSPAGNAPCSARPGRFGGRISVHNANFRRPFTHLGYKTHQPLLIGMGGIAANGTYLGADFVAHFVQLNVTATRTMGLNGASWRALGLVADEQHVMP